MRMGRTPDEAQVAVVNAAVKFDARDAELLLAIDEYGSVNRAATELERSQARASRRIAALEDAFGSLVDRQRGGRDGGGSELTAHGGELLDRYHRLAAATDATTQLDETVLWGTVATIDGELADVDTEIGLVRGIHDDLREDAMTQVRIPSDALTVFAPSESPEPDTTSARNQRGATITAIDRGQSVHTLTLDVSGTAFSATITQDSLERLGLRVDDDVRIVWKATATRLIPSRQRNPTHRDKA